MVHFNISAKFLGNQVEFRVPNSEMYTLAEMWADVYMYTCSSLPTQDEMFSAEVKFPWNGEYKPIRNDDELQIVFNMFKHRGVDTIKVDFQLLPIATPPPPTQVTDELNFQQSSQSTSAYYSSSSSPTKIVDLVNGDDEAMDGQPSLFHFLSDDDDDTDYTPNHFSDQSTDEELHNGDDSDDGGRHSDVPTTNQNSEVSAKSTTNNTFEDQLSNAASINYEQFFMMDNSSDGDDAVSKHSHTRRGIPYNMAEGGRVVLQVGQLFNNLRHFRQVLRDFAVQEGFQLRRIKNDKNRCTAMCLSERCSWRIHASPTEDRTTFMIKTLQPRHSCQKVHKNQEATASWVANKFKELIEANPDIKIKFLAHEIHRIYGLNLPPYTLYRAKNRVLNKTDKENAKSYDMLYTYGYLVRVTNPGSMAYMKTISPDPSAPATFQRFFLSFEAQRAGFLFGCRPFIGLDGCHLKGKYPGVLLAAIAMDANYGIFPLAICICEGENKDSWGWFLHHLYTHIGMDDSRRVTFMSDRQKGVLFAIEKCWPRSTSRFCVRHLIANMQSKFKGQLSGLFVWNAANKSTKVEFLEEILKLKEVNEDAYNYMMAIPLKHWALHAFDYHVKSDHTTNNVSECFNGWIDQFRAQPALTMMESIRRSMMKRMYKRLDEANKWNSSLPPLVNKKLAERQDDARFVSVLCASDREYEVKDGTKFFVVNIESQSCDCCLWELSGIPCKHAMAVLTTKRLQNQNFVHKYLTTQAYLSTYNKEIHPIPDMAHWPEMKHNEVHPPLLKRMPGRPKKNRKRGPDEEPKQKRSGRVKCKGCREWGHNIRTCKSHGGGKRKQNTAESSKTNTRKRLFEIGSSSNNVSHKRLKVGLNVGESSTHNAVRISSHVHTNSDKVSMTTAATYSQPVTTSAPLQTSGNVTIPNHSRANAGTVAGLDIDWSGLF